MKLNVEFREVLQSVGSRLSICQLAENFGIDDLYIVFNNQIKKIIDIEESIVCMSTTMPILTNSGNYIFGFVFRGSMAYHIQIFSYNPNTDNLIDIFSSQVGRHIDLSNRENFHLHLKQEGDKIIPMLIENKVTKFEEISIDAIDQ